MTLDLRLQALMRRRGIRSQSQLARIAGVSQSSIHRILLATPGYTPTRDILMRLARALDTSISWLSEGAIDLRWQQRGHRNHCECGPGSGDGDGDGDDAAVVDHHDAPFGAEYEWRRLFTQLPRAEREALLALARLMHQRQHAAMPKTHPDRCAIAPSTSRSSAPVGYPPALEPYEAYPIE